MRSITPICIALALVGCERNDSSTSPPTPVSEQRSAAETTADKAVGADNTARNDIDRSAHALTPGDQGESETDRTITQRARQNVVGKDELSMNAKNVKIITRNGVVTLRGPVDSATEKSTIVQLVNGVDGVQRVDDQLEVARDDDDGNRDNSETIPSTDQR